jgi:aspartate carbamoyltransferase catalytic subunit
MALDQNFKARDIREQLAATGMKGKNITFLDDFSRDQIQALYNAAEMLEPFMRTGVDLLKGKVLYTLFFQPSTRTRCSHENAMLRLGGGVITEADPLHNSSAAKNESLYDSLRVTSEYADVIVMRHPDDKEALGALEQLGDYVSPVISGGYGHVTHPTQGLLDSYTCWRAFGDLSNATVAIATPDLSRARSGQSFALALANMGAKIIYTGTK